MGVGVGAVADADGAAEFLVLVGAGVIAVGVETDYTGVGADELPDS